MPWKKFSHEGARRQKTEDRRQITDETTVNEKFLQGPGAVFSKRAPGRRRQKRGRSEKLR